MTPFTLNIRGQLVSYDRPVVMGIVNVTPDSFFEGSRCPDDAAIAASVAKMEKVTAAVTLYAWVGKSAIAAGSLIMLIQDFFLLLDAVVSLVHYKPGQEQEETPAGPEA